MSGTYIPTGLSIQAEQFDGSNVHKIVRLVPPDVPVKITPLYREPVLLLEVKDRPPRLVHAGDWVSWDGESVSVHSPDSFSRFWRRRQP
jgi:hypothetical protein